MDGFENIWKNFRFAHLLIFKKNCDKMRQQFLHREVSDVNLRDCRRIAVIGCPGSGKSTLAIELAHLCALPLIHLDREYWQPGWVQLTTEQWDCRHEELISGERWIIDGNYARTLPLRLAKADTVILLDMPLHTCLWSVIKRRIVFHRRARSDMAEDCPEHLSFSFLKYIWDFHKKQRSTLKAQVQTCKGVNRLIFTRRKDVCQWLKNLEECNTPTACEALGKPVRVVMDRPIGSPHPKHPLIHYPINYGYAEGIVGGDGEGQDVYVLGPDTPLTEFQGRIIGVVHRFNDTEDKWIAAAENTPFTREEMSAAVAFQEQFYDTEILC